MGYPEAQYIIDEVTGKIDSLDLPRTLPSKIVCRSYDLNVSFKIIRVDDYYDPIVVKITNKSRMVSDGYYVELVEVPVGIYKIEVTYGTTVDTVEVTVDTLG